MQRLDAIDRPGIPGGFVRPINAVRSLAKGLAQRSRVGVVSDDECALTALQPVAQTRRRHLDDLPASSTATPGGPAAEHADVRQGPVIVTATPRAARRVSRKPTAGPAGSNAKGAAPSTPSSRPSLPASHITRDSASDVPLDHDERRAWR